MNLFELVGQCCDARIYLEAGQRCAESNACYDNLRPMGTTYWFSIPFRLGVSPSILVMLHLVLMTLSIVLSILAVKKLYERRYLKKLSVYRLAFVFMGCSLAHIVFLYPTLWITLSDAPSTLLLLIGVWLLLITDTKKNKWNFLLRIIAGLCFGLATFIRVFFLYPLLASLALWLLYWLINSRRARHELIILVALIPILFQTVTTMQQTGRFAYLPPDTTGPWVEGHMDSTFIGYDTILPFSYYAWYSECELYNSLLESTRHFDPYSVACILVGRLQFYLGSYSPYTYHPESSEPKIYTSYIPNFDLLSTTEGHLVSNTQTAPISFNQQSNMIIYPSLENGLNKLWKPDPSQPGEIYQTLKLERGSSYKATIWFSAPNSLHFMTFGFRNLQKKVIASSNVILDTFTRNNKPCNVETNAVIDRTGLYELFIRSDVVDTRPAPVAGYTFNTGFFYAWDSQLSKTTKQPLLTRTWSIELLIANVLVFIGAILFFIKNRNSFDALQVLCFGLLTFCWGESIFISPEQRFAMTTLISIWIFSIALITTLHIKENQHANSN